MHINKLIFVIGALLLTVNIASAESLSPFTTDGCSAFPDGDLKNNNKWINCCIKHDFAYWKGGTADEREQADLELKQCVVDIGEPELAELMHLGVRLGGSPYFPTWYRWGYGWSFLRGYEPLSNEEKEQVRERLIEVRELIDGFIDQTD